MLTRRTLLPALSLIFAALPVIGPSQSQVSVSAGRPFFGIGNLTVEASHEVKDKFAADAPTLEQIEKRAAAGLNEMTLSGTLPGRVVIRSNTFQSKTTGDVIISIVVDVRRPVSILGTTEVMEATVWSNSTVGRATKNEAREFILECIDELCSNLQKAANPG